MAPRPKSNPRQSMEGFKKTSPGEIFWDLLTFDRLMTGPVIHLIYWAGLALIVLGGFGTIGGAVGVALREEGLNRFLLPIPVLVAGFLMLGAGALIWRSFCEFYVAVFRISDDLRFIRGAIGQGQAVPGAAMAPAPEPEPVQPVAEPQAELPMDPPRPGGRNRPATKTN
jgi:hypothetical protein